MKMLLISCLLLLAACAHDRVPPAKGPPRTGPSDECPRSDGQPCR